MITTGALTMDIIEATIKPKVFCVSGMDKMSRLHFVPFVMTVTSKTLTIVPPPDIF